MHHIFKILLMICILPLCASEVEYKNKIRDNLHNTIDCGIYPCIGKHRSGKVRDLHFVGSKLVMIVSDRISAFDFQADRCIPFKGAVLNLLNQWAFDQTKDIVPNASISFPHPNVIVQQRCDPIKVECIVRGYVWGSLAAGYEKGHREICGVALPEGLIRYQKLKEPIFTPTHKSEHDEPMTFQEMSAILGDETAEKIREYSFALYKRGQELAEERGMLFIDTKYEFGFDENHQVMLIDEANTPDSSRYCSIDEYRKFDAIDEAMKTGKYKNVSELLAVRPELKIKEQSKQFLRDLWTEKGFSYGGSGKPPAISDEDVVEISYRYIELYESLTGKTFVFPEDNLEKTLLSSLIDSGLIPEKTIGCIGGGQLLRMMAEAVRENNLPYKIVCLDPSLPCPASEFVDAQIVGGLECPIKITELAKCSDVITYELEHTNATVLKELEEAGHIVHPSPAILAIIQDKYKQKCFFKEHGLPVADFVEVNSLDDLEKGLSEFSYPALLKARRGSYDGKGNLVINAPEEVAGAYKSFSAKGPLMLERFVNFSKEISVVVARDLLGTIKTYEPAENIHFENILLESIVPARIDDKLREEARRLALNVLDLFKGVGVFCIEMFVDEEHGLLINEVAPRVHNSGHHTIESCDTSQFEQHIRAIMGLPLGSTRLRTPARMVNLLGPAEFSGEYEISVSADIDKAYIHDYKKSESKPKRKMGHVTQVGGKYDDIFKGVKLKPKDLKRIEIRVGSDSDLPRIKETFQLLDSLNLPYEVRILSAHRTPHEMMAAAQNLAKEGYKVCIGSAGGSAHLPGMTASETSVPVVALPVMTSFLDGLDSLLSMVQMPPGIPNGVVGINHSRSAALAAAQIAFLENPAVMKRICAYRGISYRDHSPASKVAIAGPTNCGSDFKKAKELLSSFSIEAVECADLEEIVDAGCSAIYYICDIQDSGIEECRALAEQTFLPFVVVPFIREKVSITPDFFNDILSTDTVLSMGVNRFTNGALYCAQIIGSRDGAVRAKFDAYRSELSNEVKMKNQRLSREKVHKFLEGVL